MEEERIMKGRSGTYLSHEIHRRLAQFAIEIVPLDEPDAVFARDSAFHLDGAFHHPMDDLFGRCALALVEHDEGFFGHRGSSAFMQLIERGL